MSWDITGMGGIACVGADVHQIFSALCSGRSGVSGLRAFDVANYRARQAYEIDDRAGPRQDEPGRATRWLHAAVAAAVKDAGLSEDVAEFPVLVGTTLRELRSAELWWRDSTPLGLADMHFAGAMYDAFGTIRTHTVASACAASLYALGMATDLIELGEADTVVVAGTDSMTESSFGGLDRVQNPPPESIRPFDSNRRGMLMGEGAVAVVLQRGGSGPGRVHARVRGVSLNCDAAHPTVPDAASVAGAIRDAHERAALTAHDIDLVVVHGSGTKHNDAVEASALHDVFAGVHPGPFVTSIKSGAGHTCGGSGLLSLVMAVLAMREGVVPPILGLDEPMPEADGLRLVNGMAATGELATAQINAIGLGGINAVAVVERVAS